MVLKSFIANWMKQTCFMFQASSQLIFRTLVQLPCGGRNKCWAPRLIRAQPNVALCGSSNDQKERFRRKLFLRKIASQLWCGEADLKLFCSKQNGKIETDKKSRRYRSCQDKDLNMIHKLAVFNKKPSDSAESWKGYRSFFGVNHCEIWSAPLLPICIAHKVHTAKLCCGSPSSGALPRNPWATSWQSCSTRNLAWNVDMNPTRWQKKATHGKCCCEKIWESKKLLELDLCFCWYRVASLKKHQDSQLVNPNPGASSFRAFNASCRRCLDFKLCGSAFRLASACSRAAAKSAWW